MVEDGQPRHNVLCACVFSCVLCMVLSLVSCVYGASCKIKYYFIPKALCVGRFLNREQSDTFEVVVGLLKSNN